MSTIFYPYWTNAPQQLIAPWALVKGSATTRSIKSVTLDLSATRTGGKAALSACLHLTIGTGGSTAIVTPCTVMIRRLFGGRTARPNSAIFQQYTGRTTAGIRQINNGSNYAAGASSFIFDGAGGTAHAIEDRLFFWGVTTIPTSSGAITPAGGCEVLRCAGGLSTPLLTDEISIYAHNDNEFIGNADSWEVWLPGGDIYSVTFDYTGATAGEAVAVMADYQTYDYDLKGSV